MPYSARHRDGCFALERGGPDAVAKLHHSCPRFSWLVHRIGDRRVARLRFDTVLGTALLRSKEERLPLISEQVHYVGWKTVTPVQVRSKRYPFENCTVDLDLSVRLSNQV